jgi:tRNA G46 methylase TrmB
VFTKAKPLLDKNAVVYVRTDHRELTLNMTVEVLDAVFPNKRMRKYARLIDKPTQTHLFRNKIEKSAEVDIVMRPAA